ncbi:MAG: AsmA-like C-terminal region-containing protein, partial [Pseudomonadota bacterium]|nr:AsmA-like C-terminal region-containing protein [Pseudomonadota bacterium]
RVATLRGAPVPIGAVHAVLSARDGPWRLGPVELTASGGRIAGTASLDTATEPASAAADLRVTGLPLDRFGRGQLAGRLDARASLHARGDRLDALLGAVSGEVSATLSGASLPAALEAKLGLDGGRWLEALLSSPARSPITCSGLQVRFAEGKGEIRYLALETADLVVRGSGALDLPRRAVDLTLTPRRKHATWLALDRAVHVAGAVGHVVVSLVDPPQSGDAAQCASVTP